MNVVAYFHIDGPQNLNAFIGKRKLHLLRSFHEQNQGHQRPALQEALEFAATAQATLLLPNIDPQPHFAYIILSHHIPFIVANNPKINRLTLQLFCNGKPKLHSPCHGPNLWNHACKQRFRDFYQDLLPEISRRQLQKQSISQIAAALNLAGHRSIRNRKLYPMLVWRIAKLLKVELNQHPI